MANIPGRNRIQTNLLRWFKKNGRDLPWRKTRDPYAIWVSEIMLQQTQVNTVIPYYQRFLKVFPTIRRLAKADLSKILKAWEGLGYYSRARNLHRASRAVLNRFHGRVPDNPSDLLTLPGIGKYTAGAILSIAYNKEAPVLDGNVKRVLSRLFAISNKSVSSENEVILWDLSESLIPKGHASSFNQALMDLGSLICTPKYPQCPRCPLRNLCKGKASGDPERYPAKEKKKKVPHLEAMAAVIRKEGKVLLRRRPPKGLLGGLWEFPNWKTRTKRTFRQQLGEDIKEDFDLTVDVKHLLGTFQQTFSHFKLTLRVYCCSGGGKNGRGKWVLIRNLHLFPMSRIHRRIAEAIAKEPTRLHENLHSHPAARL